MVNDSAPWLLYGANGYTGRRIAEEAVRRGQRPVLAGRNASSLGELAAALNCPKRVFSLNDPAEIQQNLTGIAAVLNCAGPFSATAKPIVEAALAVGIHYLDITGEIDVIEYAAASDRLARDAGIALIPAAGFDVIPSDCLAAMLHERLPHAEHLRLAFTGTGKISRGTARTMLENLPRGGRARIDGRIVRVPNAWKSAEIPFSTGKQSAVTIPWGDVAAAYHSTGVPNIEVYLAMDERRIAWLRRLRPAIGLLRLPIPKRIAEQMLRGFMGEDESAVGRGSFWAEMTDAAGNSVAATLETLDGYTLTVETALACLEKVLSGQVPPGFATPSKAFGPEFILTMPETKLHWLP